MSVLDSFPIVSNLGRSDFRRGSLFVSRGSRLSRQQQRNQVCGTSSSLQCERREEAGCPPPGGSGSRERGMMMLTRDMCHSIQSNPSAQIKLSPKYIFYILAGDSVPDSSTGALQCEPRSRAQKLSEDNLQESGFFSTWAQHLKLTLVGLVASVFSYETVSLTHVPRSLSLQFWLGKELRAQRKQKLERGRKCSSIQINKNESKCFETQTPHHGGWGVLHFHTFSTWCSSCNGTGFHM